MNWHLDILKLLRKKKKVAHSTTVDTENTSLWQVESVIEVPYVDLNVEMPEIHSFQRHQGYDLLIGDQSR